MNNTGFVTLGIAAAQAGISRNTMRDRVRSGELPAFADPRDRRRVLLRTADVLAMATPRPLPAPREEVAAVA